MSAPSIYGDEGDVDPVDALVDALRTSIEDASGSRAPRLTGFARSSREDAHAARELRRLLRIAAHLDLTVTLAIVGDKTSQAFGAMAHDTVEGGSA